MAESAVEDRVLYSDSRFLSFSNINIYYIQIYLYSAWKFIRKIEFFQGTFLKTYLLMIYIRMLALWLFKSFFSSWSDFYCHYSWPITSKHEVESAHLKRPLGSISQRVEFEDGMSSSIVGGKPHFVYKGVFGAGHLTESCPINLHQAAANNGG